MELCKATNELIPAIDALFLDTVRTVNSRDYSPEQISVWASEGNHAEMWRRKIAEQYFIAVMDGEQLAGFASLAENGYLDMFYVSSKHQRMGVGKILMNELLEQALHFDLQKVYSDVSITARPFFEKMGFYLAEQHEKIHKGVSFTNNRMERKLDND
ncbi:MAG: putative acetyltransferase [Bacteroidetes bacterium]|nr:MAG: putative acetyltransferase [Bacteroidota bacterium]